jgi:autotransporter-associated beta strand protein
MNISSRFVGLAVTLFLALDPASKAQTLAFPGALGFGAYASGGRNGAVYHVTTLVDSGAGSFRTGVSSGNRIIVFDVGGYITLASAVLVQTNVTIAGQTAPGGICLDAGELAFANRNNIICRYVRVRPGSATASTGDDCLSLYQATNCILDHCSLAFGPWNNIDAVTANNISIQHCFDADPIGQQFGAHTENVGANYSWTYNIFANSHNRNPLAKINDTFINNVDYNCSAGYTTHTSTPFKHDIVNNYFVAGPAYSSSSDFPWFQVDKNQSIYYSGNFFDGNENSVLDGSATTPYWYQGPGTVLSSPWSSWTTVIPAINAALAWRYDVSTAGAFPRDDVDTLLLSQVQTLGSGTTGTGAGTAGPNSGLYTSQAQTGLSNNGYGSITGGVAPANFSGDGLADYWKLAIGLNTNTVYPLTNTVTGYTLLENYLNFLAAPHAVTQTNTPVDINLAQFTAGFAASAVFSLTNATNGTVSLVSGTNAHFVPTANFSGLGTFTFNVVEGVYALSATVTICVTPMLPPVSAVTFNGAMVAAATNSAGSVVVPPANLTWRGDGTANVWNLSVSNWLNGASAAAFKNGDVVTFSDTGSSTPAISLNTTVLPGAVLFDGAQNYTVTGNGALSGSGSFSKTGTGTVTIGTTNTGYTGGVNIGGGTLALNTGTSIGSGVLNISGGATLNMAAGNTPVSIPGKITVPAGDSANIVSGYVGNGGYGNFVSGDTNSMLNFSGNQSFGGTGSSQFSGFTGTINISSGNIRFSTAMSGMTFGSLNPNFIINGTLQPRNAGNTIILGALNGSGRLAGQQTQPPSGGTGNTTFTGTNALLAGTLLMNATNNASLTTVYSGATLGGTGVMTGVVAVNAGGRLSPGGNGIGTLTINGNLTNATPTLNFALSAFPGGANDQIIVNGALVMSGPQTFNFDLADTALGAGTYDLIEGATNSTQSSVSFASNLPGNTRQNISFASVAGSNPSFVRLVVSGNASSLLWTGTNGSAWDTSTVNWLNGASADQYYNLDMVTFDDSSTNGMVLLVGALQPATLLVNNNSLAYTFGGSGALSGFGTLTKTGSGTLTINTTNSSYTGNIILTNGTLALGGSASLGTGAMTIGAGATFSLPANGNSVAVNRAITVSAGQMANITSGVLANTLGSALISGNSSSTLNLSGGMSFSGADSSQFDGFTGTINLQSGATLRFSTGNSNTYSSFNPTFIINGTLQPRNAGNTIQLGAFSGSGTLAGPQSNTGTGDTLYVFGGNNTSATFSGVISSNSAVANSGVIVNKIGSGMLTLSGANTYAGSTTVSGGTLRVSNASGSATGSGDLELFAGTTLTGTGIIASAATIDNGAVLAPGNPGGALTISNLLTLNDGSLLQFGLGANGDTVAVSGDLALTGQLTVTDASGFGTGSYPLFTYGGALNYGNLQLVSAPSGYNYNFDTNTPGVVKLVVTLPVIGSSTLIGGQFVFAGSGGKPGTAYYVNTSTNLAAPVGSWTCVQTNYFDANGNFSVTNGPTTNSQSFYRLELP